MSSKIIALAALLAAGFSMPTMAQQANVIDDLDAERINATQIAIDFDYEGGACEQVGPAVVGAQTEGTLAVNFPLTTTAEVCTQQIVDIDVEQTIEAADTVTRVEVTLTAPDGTIRGTDTTDVDND